MCRYKDAKKCESGITALHVFVTLTDAYLSGKKEITLSELKPTLIRELHEYMTDGRSRSTKRSLKILAEYSLIEESENRFGEPVYSLKSKSDELYTVFLNIPSFLDDMTKGRTGDKQLLERIEANLPAIIEVLRDNQCFSGVSKEKENIVLSIFETLASEQGISLYEATKFFHRRPQIMRIYRMLTWIAMVSEKYGQNLSAEIVVMTFYEACSIMIPEQLDLAGVDKLKDESILKRPSFKGAVEFGAVRTILVIRPYLPAKVREKLDALHDGSI